MGMHSTSFLTFQNKLTLFENIVNKIRKMCEKNRWAVFLWEIVIWTPKIFNKISGKNDL